MYKQIQGFTLIEIVLAIGIVTLIGGVVLSSLSQFRTRKSLDAAVEETLSAFSRAHLDSISSLNEKEYGVHIESDKVVYFIGPTYGATETTNSIYKLVSAIEIANIALAGGGNDVLFNRLSGGTNQDGTFEIRAKSNNSIKTIVIINGTGAISL